MIYGTNTVGIAVLTTILSFLIGGARIVRQLIALA